MRLYALRRHYGLRWKTGLPPFDWRIWLDGLIFIALACAVLALVDYIGQNADLADANARAVYRADKAEANLAHCLNGGSMSADGGMVMCQKAHWVRIVNHG